MTALYWEGSRGKVQAGAGWCLGGWGLGGGEGLTTSGLGRNVLKVLAEGEWWRDGLAEGAG